MTELVQYQPQTALTDVMEYARAVSSASMLPDNYRGKPADIMLAVGLGQSMGLSPAESLYRIAVIKGKPTASAELIAANVRKAGHKLRVRGDDTTCTATITRADDPEFEFVVTRDINWAKGMGLSDQPNYRKQPGTMLQWRAITAVARLACPEALYGVSYTADEIEPDERPTRSTSQGSLGAALAPTVTAEQVHDDEMPANDHPADPEVAAKVAALRAEWKDADPERRKVIEGEVNALTTATEDDARAVLKALEADA